MRWQSFDRKLSALEGEHAAEVAAAIDAAERGDRRASEVPFRLQQDRRYGDRIAAGLFALEQYTRELAAADPWIEPDEASRRARDVLARLADPRHVSR